MLVQENESGLRLVTQNDHGLFAGRLAHEWWGLDGEPTPLPFELVFATSLHDQSWVKADRAPTLNQDTGIPHDFNDYPKKDRARMYREGLDFLSEIDPYAGLLVSLHYYSFTSLRDVAGFGKHEESRQDDLRAALGFSEPGMKVAERHLAYLQLFDLLSLHIVLSPPRATGDLPGWLEAEAISKTPVGTPFQIQWFGDSRVTLDPFPFRQAFHVEIPYRDLPYRRYANDGDLKTDWENAELEFWPLEIS